MVVLLEEFTIYQENQISDTENDEVLSRSMATEIRGGVCIWDEEIHPSWRGQRSLYLVEKAG